MRHLQRYLFLQLLGPLTVACVTLAVLALLTQTLSSLSLIIEDGETFFLLMRIVFLTLPQLLGLVLPVALFVAVIHGLQRLHADSELVVAGASGLSRWGVLSPILRLAVCVMAAQLAIGLWLQPLSHREMRRTLHQARVEMVSGLVEPGAFTHPADDLTIFVRSAGQDGRLEELMIEDRRSQSEPVYYLAKYGRIVESATSPAILLEDANMQTIESDGRYSFLEFDSVPFELDQFIEPPGQLLYKLSDRYLHELLFLNPVHYWERENAGALYAEGHSRIAAPLYDLALALIAAFAMLGGDYKRTGYAVRIAVAAVAALTLRVGGFAVQAGAAEQPALNPLQYALPGAVCLIVLVLYFTGAERSLRSALRGSSGAPRAVPA